MASKFFNKPQLGQAQLTNSQQSNLSGVDVKAEMRAISAAKSIESLSNSAQGAVQSITGAYIENINAKNRLESRKQTPFFLKHVKKQIISTENFESIGDDGLKTKYTEYAESFMEKHKDKPYANELRENLDKMEQGVLTDMVQQRGALHVKKVSDATAEGASIAGQMLAEGLINQEQFAGRLAELDYDATLGLQDPASSGLSLSDEYRNKYRENITSKQAKEAILRGLMIQTGKPNNSVVADILDTPEFRESMGISPTDEDYNKLVAVAKQKGARADKVNYEQGLDSFKESLYTKTNQGFEVNIDKELETMKASGQVITAQDEHKIRKQFKQENDIIVSSLKYKEGLVNGIDRSAGLPKKQREALFERSFTDVLGITGEELSVGNVNAALSTKEGQVAFGEYIEVGGKIPDKFTKMFDVPAGSGQEKWDNANDALNKIQAASLGSGQAVEAIIGVKQVSKIRGMSRIWNDPNMEDSVKRNAIEALEAQSTSFNSKGYLKGSPDTPIDTEWLNDVSKDAPWTTDDYVSDMQNSAEIAGNYHAYRMAGNSDEDAKELAMDLFNKSNRSMEMSNGGEIVIPVNHKNLNNISIDEFSKSVDANGKPRFPSIMEQRSDLEISTGEGWISEWRARTNISFQKSHNYGKTGNYDMLYNGRLVDRAQFSYSELEDFISKSPSRLREKMTGGKHRSISEVEEDATNNRRKNIKSKQDQRSLEQHLFDLKI